MPSSPSEDPQNPQLIRLESWSVKHLPPESAYRAEHHRTICEKCPRCVGFSEYFTGVDCLGAGRLTLLVEGQCPIRKW
jgi:hypothetical protein